MNWEIWSVGIGIAVYLWMVLGRMEKPIITNADKAHKAIGDRIDRMEKRIEKRFEKIDGQIELK